MQQPVIHIGYNKTGSTWLQEEVFPKQALGFQSFLTIEDRENIYRSTVRQHAMTFDPAPILNYYQQALEKHKGEELVPIFSNERLSGDPHSQGYDTKELADRLHRMWPEARIIIVIREQKSMLLSTYKQYIRAGGPRSLRSYFSPPERGSRRVPMFAFDYFAYDSLIRYYQSLFGKERVLVLPYEQLRKEPQAFVSAILTFSGLPARPQQLEQLGFKRKINAGYGPITLRLKRQVNRIFIDNGLNPGAWFSMPYGVERRVVALLQQLDRLLPKPLRTRSEQKMKAYIAHSIKGRYASSNQKVEELTGLNLGEFGYDL
ncbi:MAG: sulfotransferase domain-containing protein [Bacteroidota bacterium]